MKTKIRREILIILLILITPMLHESAHFIFFIINGIPATMRYSVTISEKASFSAKLAGPLYHIIVGGICIILANYNQKNKNTWAIIGLVAGIFRIVAICMIIIITFIIPSATSDEGQVAHMLGIPSGIIYFFSFIINFLFVYLNEKNLKDKKVVMRIFLYTILVMIFVLALQVI